MRVWVKGRLEKKRKKGEGKGREGEREGRIREVR